METISLSSGFYSFVRFTYHCSLGDSSYGGGGLHVVVGWGYPVRGATLVLQDVSVNNNSAGRQRKRGPR